MIKEKYIPYLATIAMLLMLALVVVGSVFNLTAANEKKDVTTIQQPEYMSKIFDQDQVLQINIQMDENKWEELKENAAEEEYYPADITINGETYRNIGIRAKGNSSLSMVAGNDTTDRYSFKIKTDEYQDQNIYGLKKFVLNNMIGDATYMKEYISYDMCKEMGIATPGYAFANITINGEPWGVYLAVEALEESFIERNFGDLDGNLYKVEGMGGMGAMGGGMPPQMPDGNQRNNNDKGRTQVPENKASGNQSGNSPEGATNPPVNFEKNGNMMPPNGSNQNSDMMPPNGGNQNGGMMPPSEGNQDGMQNNRGQMKWPGGMGSKGGANLVYTDDEISSYSSIFNYTILNKTTTNDYKTLINILKNLNEGTNLEDNIDVEEVLKYFAVNTFIVNLDSYAGNMKHNFYLYEEDGKLQILPWDYNLAFGAFEMQDASKVINFPIDTPVTDSMENSPLISKLLEVDAYKEMYHSYLQELIDKYITSGKYEATIEKLDALIGDYVKGDTTAFYTYDEYQVAIKELKQYGIDRTTSIEAQLSGEQPSTEYGTVATNIDLMAMGQQMGGKGGPGGMGSNQSGPMFPNENMPNNMPNEGQVNEAQNQDAMKDDMRQPQRDSMRQMPNVDMELMWEVMNIIGDTSSVDEMTEEQKKQIIELGIDESALEQFFEMKNTFGNMRGKGQHNGMPGQMSQSEMSEADKIIAVVCTVLLVGGLVFAITFKRKRY